LDPFDAAKGRVTLRAVSYRDALMSSGEPEGRSARMRRLVLELLTLSMSEDDIPSADGRLDELDGTQPEIYVAPRISPSP